MNILYVLNSGNPGGMEKHVLDLVSGMVALGHHVFVWCDEGEVVDWYKQAGAQVFVQKLKYVCDFEYIYKLCRFLKENKIDVLHAHELKVVANAGVAGFFAKTPVKVSHTHTPVSEWKISRVAKIINIFINSVVVNLFYDKEIALTESRKQVKISEGINPEKIEIIPNGVDVVRFDITDEMRLSYKKMVREEFGLPDNAFVFGCVGRMTEEKGHAVLVKAFAEFVKIKNTENVYLLLAGGGKLEGEIRLLIDQLGLAGRLLITGVYPQADFEKYLFSMDSFVMPSLAEGFGIVLIEAMAAGLPIICSDLPVLQEVGGSTVFYFECGNVADLVGKLDNMFKRADAFGEVGLAAKSRVSELFGMEGFVRRYGELYGRLFEGDLG